VRTAPLSQKQLARHELFRLASAYGNRVKMDPALSAEYRTFMEQGPAGLSVIADQWLYTTTTVIASGTPILVEATAADRPGNLGVGKVQSKSTKVGRNMEADPKVRELQEKAGSRVGGGKAECRAFPGVAVQGWPGVARPERGFRKAEQHRQA
jgi:hypothetical protein